MSRNWRLIAVFATYTVASAALLALATNMGAPVWFTGGMDCTTSQGVYACVGYPPVGGVIIIGGVILVGEVVRSGIHRLKDRLAPV